MNKPSKAKLVHGVRSLWPLPGSLCGKACLFAQCSDAKDGGWAERTFCWIAQCSLAQVQRLSEPTFCNFLRKRKRVQPSARTAALSSNKSANNFLRNATVQHAKDGGRSLCLKRTLAQFYDGRKIQDADDGLDEQLNCNYCKKKRHYAAVCRAKPR